MWTRAVAPIIRRTKNHLRLRIFSPQPVKNLITNLGLRGGIDAICGVVEREVEPFHAKTLHPGIMFEEQVDAFSRLLVDCSLAKQIRIHAETKL